MAVMQVASRLYEWFTVFTCMVTHYPAGMAMMNNVQDPEVCDATGVE